MILTIVSCIWVLVVAALFYLKGRNGWKFSHSYDDELLDVALVVWPLTIVIILIGCIAEYLVITPMEYLQNLGKKHRKQDETD